MSEAERQAERDERVLACVEALKLADLNYHANGNEVERRIKAQAWALTLDEVPAGEIRALMQAELRGRTSDFPPDAPGLLRRWQGKELDHAGKPMTRSNAAAYRPYQPTPKALPEPEGLGALSFRLFGQRMRQGLGPVQCQCGQTAMLHPDGWACRLGQCGFWLPVEETLSAPAAVEGARPSRSQNAGETPALQDFEPDVFDDEASDADVVAQLLARTGVG